MVFTKSTLSQQIFFSMIGLMSLALVIVAVININKIQKDTETYNAERLSRKDRAVAKSIEAIINLSTQYNVDLETAFRPILKDVGYIHKLKINIYNLDGQFIWSSDTTLLKDTIITQTLSKDKINQCFVSENKKTEYEKGAYFGTYRILYKDTATNQLTSSKPIINDNPFCILDVIYDKSTKEDVLEKTNQQIKSLIKLYVLLLFFASVFAYLLLKQITAPLRAISKHLSVTNQHNRPQPLKWHVNDEIGHLIEEYNNLMIELEKRTNQLIKSEKEGAWKKMAKQIAHEIKNPLTPMRLNVQYLIKSFKDGEGAGLYSDNWKDKLESFSKTMIQQIDTLTSISNAFSDFASLNNQASESLCLKEELNQIAHLFKNNNVHFVSKIKQEVIPRVFMDKSHLTRVFNNLIKNSIQASQTAKNNEIRIELYLKGTNYTILVKDNGVGIPKDIQEKIFEPNFTTKNSGMGLGLAMVKKIISDFNGTINYTTSSEGTVFEVTIPTQINN